MGKKHIKQPEIYQHDGRVGVSPFQYVDPSSDGVPTFCFKYLHKDYNLTCCSDESDKRFTKGLLRKIEHITQHTWSQIQLADRQGLGTEKISRKSVKAAIPSQISPDVKDFISFYYAGDKGRIIGFRGKDTIFHVVYIDTKLRVYTH